MKWFALYAIAVIGVLYFNYRCAEINALWDKGNKNER